ncbi:MAG TPA: HAD family hydrolase [Nitrososphaeraceae archaeon]|nr:HAD family hydrolase [Nitrososphaeraceae archaeon]
MYKLIDKGTSSSIDQNLKSFVADCILFDVDGVLVDTRKSYNIAISKTVDFVIKYVTGRSNLNGLVNQEIILKFRYTGGFNNDTDTSYAISLAALTNPYKKKNVNDMREFISYIASNANENGITSVERLLSSLSSSSFYNIRKLKELLAYPGPIGKSIVTTVFDEIFYGTELYKKRHGLEPKYYFGKPLIENDKLVVTKSTINTISEMFNGNIAIVSGRSKLATEFSLRSIFNIFNQKASVFLEDENREHSKPNPYAIKKAMDIMGSKRAIYVGDSIEDLLMSQRVKSNNESSKIITFFGVYGCSARPAHTISQFRENNVDALIENVNQLPNMLNKALVKL